MQSETVRRLLTEHLAFVKTQLAELWQLIEEHIDRHPDLKADQALLTSIPGVGQLIASKLQTLQLKRFATVRAASAFAGLNPQQRLSGSSVHGQAHLSKMGPAEVRRALYMPAVVAKRFNPLVRALCERLAAKGKHNLAILGAAMHKLVCLAYGVLKSGVPFDPNYAKLHALTP